VNGLERVRAALAFGRPDRVPVIAQVFGHAAVLAGVPLDQYLRDGALLARCQLAALDAYGYDAVFALLDVNVESEALGSVLRYRPGRYAEIDAYALAGDWDLDRLEVPDPHRAGRMPEVLTAAARLRQAVGEEVLVVGCTLGPMTLCSQLLGLEAALYLAVDEPERFARLLDFATDVLIGFGTAQLAAGVHLPVVFDPSATAEVIPPQFYRELLLPRLHRLFSAFREAGAAAAWLHTAGQTGPILPFYPQAGVDLANIDFCVDPQRVAQALPRTCLNGNLRSLAFVEEEPAQIARAAGRLLDLFADRGGFILSSGCEIPPEARPENIAALVAAARRGI
jgi:uroporphyrinogen decarboxylase